MKLSGGGIRVERPEAARTVTRTPVCQESPTPIFLPANDINNHLSAHGR